MRPEEYAIHALQEVARARGETDLLLQLEDAYGTLVAGYFNVAFIGQFKRGKSTLVNALLGHDLLPADATPVTSAITIVEHGVMKGATVAFADGRKQSVPLEDLALFVAEQNNPGNRLGIAAVVLVLDHPLLATGMRLVDTPGVGSMFTASAEVTRQFLPRIDVAVAVLGCDPPITGEELALVRELATSAGRLVCLLNKSDLAAPTVRDKVEAFTRGAIAEAAGVDPGPLLHTAARPAAGAGDLGVEGLRSGLLRLAQAYGQALSTGSAARAVRHVAAHLRQRLDLEEAALRLPVEEADRKLAAFEEAVRDVSALCLAAFTRVRQRFAYDWAAWERRREAFVADQLAALDQSVRQPLAQAATGRAALRRLARERAVESVRCAVGTWLAAARDELARYHDRHAADIRREVEPLLERVVKAATDIFAVEVAPLEVSPLPDERRRFKLDLASPVQALDPQDWLLPLLDLVTPRGLVARRLARRAAADAREWLRRNLSEVDQRLVAGLDATTRGLQSALQARLQALEDEVVAAVTEGRRRRQLGEAAVAGDLATIAAQRREVEEAVEGLEPQRSL